MKRSHFAILVFASGLLAGYSETGATTVSAVTGQDRIFVSPAPVAAAAIGQAAAGQAAPAARPKFVAPVKGEAEIGYLKPNVKVVKEEVITVIKVKNLSNGAIAGLRVEEFWWDKANNPLPADSQRLRKPLMPGEVATIELHTPKNPGMNRNSYKFSHANGTIKAKLLTKID